MTQIEKLALIDLVHEAMRFALWAAGEGICPAPGEPSKSPGDFLYNYSCAADIDEWDGLPEFVRDTFKTVLTSDKNSDAGQFCDL